MPVFWLRLLEFGDEGIDVIFFFIVDGVSFVLGHLLRYFAFEVMFGTLHAIPVVFQELVLIVSPGFVLL